MTPSAGAPPPPLLPLLPPPPPPPPYLVATHLHFADLYVMALACGTLAILLVVVGCAGCSQRRHDRANHNRFDRDVERQQHWVGAEAPKVVVVEYCVGERKFDIDECVICLEDFKEGEECGMLEVCGHGYHESCIKEWLSKHQHCMLCRALVRVGQATSVMSTLA
ncbi:hypothetical protein BT93_I0905 [Corymbia citriodora subsp. variegata]|nr:hypothetical protein BT93_I0905 [Corymbia citriodora subsp. variegata]